MKQPAIIGIGGTNASGKDTVMQFLADQYNFLFISVTDMLSAELTKRGLPLDRTHKAALSAEWRREHGMGVLVMKAYETFGAQAARYAGLVTGSLRHPAEADIIHELGGTVLWLDADPQIRYARIRANNRGRADEDNVSYDQFLADEAREMHPTGDGATLNMAAVKDRADATLINNEDVHALKAHLRQVLRISA